MIDWRLAERIAGRVSPTPAAPPGRLEAIAAEVEAFAPRSAELVTAYTGLADDAVLPEPESVDREAWTRTNLRTMRGVLEPTLEKTGRDLGPLGGPVRLVAGGLLAAEAGALSGFLAGRVLGQYEFPILDPEAPARLLFVTPNLLRAVDALGADQAMLVRWVALHETTHAVQFAGVPWLRPFLAERVQTLLDSANGSLGNGKLPTADELKALVADIRRDGMLAVVAGPQRKAAIDELQSVMALIEGHAEHVMDAVGADELDDLPGLRKGLERRRQDRSPWLRLIERLIGFDLKLRQYEQGKRFCDAVVERAGIAGLNQAFAGPQALPTATELDDPAAWLSRV